MAETYNQEGIDALVNPSRPIPGQSLTDSPEQSYPWESPPEFTDFRQAFNYLAEELLEEIKEHRNDMVARNYPYQQLTNLIYKWEEILKKDKDENQ